MDMKFTIITVCYNAQNDIEKTIESVLGQTYEDFQYIIKDGQSTDCTLEQVKKNIGEDPRIIVKSCKDSGIYDAMNQALQQTEGEYVFFLNAGDIFHDLDVLKNVSDFIDEHSADVVYGNIVLKEKERSRIKRYGNLYQHKWMYLLGDCICHQAIFARRELFTKRVFNTKYKICADREWQMFYMKERKVFLPSEVIISDVLVEGFSLRNVELLETEAEECLQQHFSHMAWIYKCFRRCKRMPIARWILRKIL